jgi:hypothetical protein
MLEHLDAGRSSSPKRHAPQHLAQAIKAFLVGYSTNMETSGETRGLAHHQMTRVQLDALWTCVGHEGQKGDAPKKTHGGDYRRGENCRNGRHK